MINVKMDSKYLTRVSVVIPLRASIFSENTLVITPGARSYLSNQLICLWSVSEKSSILRTHVTFSPITPKIEALKAKVETKYTINAAKPFRVKFLC